MWIQVKFQVNFKWKLSSDFEWETDLKFQVNFKWKISSDFEWGTERLYIFLVKFVSFNEKKSFFWKRINTEWFTVDSQDSFEILSALFINHWMHMVTGPLYEAFGSRPVQFQPFISLYIFYALHYFS